MAKGRVITVNPRHGVSKLTCKKPSRDRYSSLVTSAEVLVGGRGLPILRMWNNKSTKQSGQALGFKCSKDITRLKGTPILEMAPANLKNEYIYVCTGQ